MKSNSTPYYRCFEVLGNPLRIEIIQALRKCQKSVGELAEQLGEEQSKVSHSLAVLRKCGFVETKRQGKKIVYSLRETLLKKIEAKNLFDALEKHYRQQGCKCWRKEK